MITIRNKSKGNDLTKHNNYNKQIDLSIVIFPNSTSDLMATQIKSLELDFPNAQFLRGWMLGRLMLHQSLQTNKTHIPILKKRKKYPQTKKRKEKIREKQKNNDIFH